ncbi:MAG: PTS sugar transporter subunit IIA, partial [Planctomycetes bacterium]|nr:PTS sugar transporter subunit IIA [Planctomycetota bacterium]
VEGWIRDEGLPHTPDRGRLLFDRAQVAQWAAERGLAAKAGFLAPVTPAFASGARLTPLLRAGGVWRDVSESEVLNVFERVVTALPGATPTIVQLLRQRLHAAGGINWAPVGGGFALPHLSMRVALGRDSGAVALVFLRSPLKLAEPPSDGVPVTRLFFFVAPSPRAHIDLLGRFGRLLLTGPLRELLARSPSDDEVFEAVAAIDAVTSNGPSANTSP